MMTLAVSSSQAVERSAAERYADRLFVCLGALLAGYATAGRGFAYLGLPPLFVGEALLAAGLCFLLTCPTRVLGRVVSLMMPVVALVLWCARRAAQDFSTYGMDTIRDSATWYYSGYAFIVCALLLARPQRFVQLLSAYRRYLLFFLTVGVIFAAMSRLLAYHMPDLPWAPGVPLISVRPGDTAVHLTGAFAFLTLFGGVPIWLASVAIPVGMAFAVSSRAAMFSFVGPSALLGFYRPMARVGWALLCTGILLIFIAWAFDIRVQTSTYEGREFSVDTLLDSVTSVLSDESKAKGAMEETKAWRLNWWSKIIAYTVHGDYFWNGKGFGINLADEDGFQVQEDKSLRSPHNGHLTYLARAGVPGFALWVAAQLYWLARVADAWVRAARAGRKNWTKLFVFVACYWAAFMINASFDVFLEGPMGGIWFWCVYGFGLAITVLAREYPDLLDERGAKTT